jgi:hypothetical protein
MLPDFLQANLKSFLLFYFIGSLLFLIAFIGNAQHRLKRLDNPVLLHFRNARNHCAKFNSPSRLHNHVGAPFNIKMQRVKKIDLTRRPKSYANNPNHLSTSQYIQLTCSLLPDLNFIQIQSALF